MNIINKLEDSGDYFSYFTPRISFHYQVVVGKNINIMMYIITSYYIYNNNIHSVQLKNNKKKKKKEKRFQLINYNIMLLIRYSLIKKTTSYLIKYE